VTLRPYKFIVQAVVQETNEDAVVGEQTTEPVTLYGCDALAEWAGKFTERLTSVDG
jgi:hypothetical protein